MTLDPFTPWQEDPAALEARTVGRSAVLDWLVSACDAFLSGEEASWCLVAGPRGAGKSHVLQIARSRIGAPGSVTWVGEDTATTSDADALWERIWNPEDPWGWAPAPQHAARRILFVEGLDRLLAALRPEGRWALRHHLQESGAFLVGTALDTSLAAGSGEAFFGQLDTWTLEPLPLATARALFDRLCGDEGQGSPATLTRREALIRMSGGSPRAIVTLAEAVRGTDGDAVGAAEGLLRAVQRLVTHYQQRFHDLPPLGQRLLEVLARAPRELTAGEVQKHTGATSAAISATARTLEAAGALHRSPDPDDARVSRYALAEPMFRYWLEYRTMPSWSATRVAWFGRLLGEVLTREELADVWWGAEATDIRSAIEATGEPGLILKAWRELLASGTSSDQEDALQRTLRLEPDMFMALLWVHTLLKLGRHDLLPHLAPWCGVHPELAALLDFAAALEGGSPKAAFLTLIRALRSAPAGHHLLYLSEIVRALLDRLGPHGRPWKAPAGQDAAALAAVPYLRVRFATEGRRPTHPPLLAWSRLTSIPIDSQTPDLDEMLAAAHQRRDLPFFARVAAAMGEGHHSLPSCPRPERLAPAPGLLAPLFGRHPLSTLTWAASLAGMSAEEAEDAIAALAGASPQPHPWNAAAEGAALLALGLRTPERFEALAAALPEHPSIVQARRTLPQLRERARGRLQPEIELVWQAVAPRDDEG